MNHGYVRTMMWGVSDAVRAGVRPFEGRSRYLIALVAVGALVGCSGAMAGAPAPEGGAAPADASRSTPTTVPSRPETVKVFFVKGEQFAARSRTVPLGMPETSAAVRALLAGPTTAEKAAGIDTALPARTRLVSLSVRSGTAVVELSHGRTRSTALDVSLRPARAAQIVYTLTATPAVREVLIRVNGVDRATFIGSRLALKGPLEKHDLSRPIKLPAKPRLVPNGPAPADPHGVQKRLTSLRYLPPDVATGRWDARTSQAVLAFQAWEGLARDGIVGAQTLAALENAREPTAASTPSRGGRHVEVYRDKGVTLLVEEGKVVRVLHSSSGTHGYETPRGSYSIFRKERSSWSVPYQVWLPYASYFNAHMECGLSMAQGYLPPRFAGSGSAGGAHRLSSTFVSRLIYAGWCRMTGCAR